MYRCVRISNTGLLNFSFVGSCDAGIHNLKKKKVVLPTLKKDDQPPKQNQKPKAEGKDKIS